MVFVWLDLLTRLTVRKPNQCAECNRLRGGDGKWTTWHTNRLTAHVELSVVYAFLLRVFGFQKPNKEAVKSTKKHTSQFRLNLDSVVNAFVSLLSLISLRPLPKYNLRNSNDELLLSHPCFKSKATLGDRSFICATPKLWNALPFDIRSANTTSIFKARLKLHFFVGHFSIITI